MKMRMVMVCLLLLVMAPLAILAADSEENGDAVPPSPSSSMSKEQIKELLAGQEGNTGTILAMEEDRVFFLDGDSGYRLTDKTRYYSSDGIKLARSNFQKDTEVRYFQDSPFSVGLMIKLH